MLIKFKNKDSNQTDTAELAAELRDSKQKEEYFLLSVQVLLQFMKEFALDLKEINSDEFKKDISQLSEKAKIHMKSFPLDIRVPVLPVTVLTIQPALG